MLKFRSELFSQSEVDLTFDKKIETIKTMMEKLFILGDNDNYLLRVENDAIPISDHIK
jgi:hypothetical protein